MSSYIWSIDGLTIAMSIPALIAWYRNAECIASRTALFPLKENDRLDTPPEVRAPGRFVLIHLTASMKSMAYFACSSMPVPMDRMFTSKIMSSGATPASWVRSLYALSQISTLRSYVVACPCSSKAITTIAAPRDLMVLAFSTKASGPSLRLIEFTIHFPCAFFRPARIVSQWEESIISAAFATAGSFDIWRTKRSISLVLSSMASSMLMSIIGAPSSICFAAIWSASSYLPSEIRRANFLEPATLVRSPTFMKLLRFTSTATASRPLTLSTFSSLFSGSWRGWMPARDLATARMWSGVVPQHPPTMFTSPFDAIVLTCSAIVSGLWSYPPISLGSPALG